MVALVEELTDNLNPGKFVKKISSRCNVPYTIPCQNGITVKYHYQNVRVNENDPYFEEFVLFPYVIDVYPEHPGDIQITLSRFDDNYILRHITEMPFINFPWYDPDKVRNKLKTYLVFS